MILLLAVTVLTGELAGVVGFRFLGHEYLPGCFLTRALPYALAGCLIHRKLSRFGRNAADVLNSLQRMQDYGVNLICVEDGIDSSKDSGKLMISVLSAVAEIERENILAQTMEGRRQKAREGKWNGGFAPHGYKLVDGYLEIAEDEAEIIRLIFEKYVTTSMGLGGVAKDLNVR